ncbi:MAG: CDP-diacylglycerol--glycerol-3-phosphate 3-phosphatidyltransferase [Nitrospinae bacterium]|nr:CDP-diacylglycerol--glycerol-3-phosphate 3-phosphatidyltransferase [Nitrospinota bacterium]
MRKINNPYTIPNLVTASRIAMIPLFVAAYFIPYRHANIITTVIFVAAALTDWLDGYLARSLEQTSPFGAFLDPVADKLMVAAALILLLSDTHNDYLLGRGIFSMAVLIIIGREITISALREWMAELGKRSKLKVSNAGKVKTGIQMTAIPFILYHDNLFGLPIFFMGEILLYAAAAMTAWTMVAYLQIAWKDLTDF